MRSDSHVQKPKQAVRETREKKSNNTIYTFCFDSKWRSSVETFSFIVELFSSEVYFRCRNKRETAAFERSQGRPRMPTRYRRRWDFRFQNFPEGHRASANDAQFAQSRENLVVINFCVRYAVMGLFILRMNFFFFMFVDFFVYCFENYFW